MDRKRNFGSGSFGSFGGHSDDREDRGSFGGGGSFAPVKVGDILEVKIEAIGEKGDGVAKIKGFVLFVPNAKKDEVVKVKVTRVLRKVGFAEIVGSGTESTGEESESSEDSEEEEQSGEEETKDPESNDSENYEDSEQF